MDSRLKPEIDDEEEDDERPPRLMTTESQAFSETPGGVVDPPSSRVSFVCQRCLQPLTIDPSFSSMNEHVTAELSLPISPVPPLPAGSALASKAPEMDRFVPPFKLTSAPPESGFTLVGETGAPINAGVISAGLRMTADLYDMLSNNGGGLDSQAQIDHPLCEECTDSLLETMDQQLKCAEDEAQQYQSFLQKLDREEGTDEEAQANIVQLQQQLKNLLAEEEQLKETLQTLDVEKQTAKQEYEGHVKDRQILEKQERKFWKEYSKHKRDLLLAEDEFRTLDLQNKYVTGQLDKLKRTNVFSQAFHIWLSGHFATINGLRLGRLPSVPVEWAEINAAWGQTALLLASLAKVVGPDPFQKYQIVPYGSYSYIKVLADGKVLPLYGTGGFRMIWDTKFDQAMVAFLDCLQQFGHEVDKNGDFNLPYEMDKGKIKDNNTNQWYSVKLQFNSEDLWTKACRHILTNLKWGLAFVGIKYLKREEGDSGSTPTRPEETTTGEGGGVRIESLECGNNNFL